MYLGCDFTNGFLCLSDVFIPDDKSNEKYSLVFIRYYNNALILVILASSSNIAKICNGNYNFLYSLIKQSLIIGDRTIRVSMCSH